ncbi:MAG: TIGR03943 family putative permease subunit, partial [Roseiflexaceae bacterium]
PSFALAFVLIPVALGLGVPPRPLDANAISTRLDSLNRVAQRPNTSAAILAAPHDTTQWNLYDWAVAMSIDTAPLVGQAVLVDGFVVRPADMPQAATEFMLARYVLTCCTADAGGVGMPVAWAHAASLNNDQWLRVAGVIARHADGQIFIVAQQITPIEIPRKPYLSP